MSYRAAALWLGVALLVIAAIGAAMPVHANGIDCGSVLQPYSSGAEAEAQIADVENGTSTHDYAADCDSRRGTQTAWVLPLALIGAVAAGFVLMTSKDRQTRAV